MNGNAEAPEGPCRGRVDIPTFGEIRALIPHLRDGREPLLILVAMFTGLRAGELRRWKDVGLERSELHLRQRIDRFRSVGPLKSAAGRARGAASARRGECAAPAAARAPARVRSRVPPPGRGARLDADHQRPLAPGSDLGGSRHRRCHADGKPKPEYPGFHAPRHFYASRCINRRAHGGLELPIKVVRGRLGHASTLMTADRHGHLFPRGDDAAELAAAERAS
jgi:integrase